MKKIILIFILFSGSSNLFAQDCSKYLFMQKNKQIEMSSIGDKGEPVRKSLLTVTDVSSANGMLISKVIVTSTGRDGKQNKSTIEFKCNGGIMLIDMNFNSGQTGKQSEDMKTGYLEYPAGMRVGDHLKDASSPIEMNMGGEKITGVTKVTNRVILAKENVTTTAGTWSCFKITYTMTVLLNPMKGIKIPPQSLNVTEWFAPNFSVIKTQMDGGTTIEITGIK